MQRLSRRFERWRNAHTGRLPIPTRLWTAAAELAREHGVFPTAKALRLEYGKLKQQAELLGPTTKRRGVNTFRSFDGIHIAYYGEGKGPAVIFPPGGYLDGLGQYGDFEHILPHWRGERGELRYGHPGQNGSGRPV